MVFCVCLPRMFILRNDVLRLSGETLTPVFEFVSTTLFGFVFPFLRLAKQSTKHTCCPFKLSPD